MDTRLTIFFASTCVALIINAALAWGLYVSLRSASARVTEQLDSITRSGGAREWLDSMASASGRAAELTSAAKVEIQAFEPSLIRAEEMLTRRLANVDQACDRACGVLSSTMNLGSSMTSSGFGFIRSLFSGARVASAIVRAARAR